MMRKTAVTFLFIPLFLLSASGQGLFGPENIISVGAHSDLNDQAVADLDGDGHYDIMISSSYRNGLVWFRNNGFGTFSDPIILIEGRAENAQILVSDVDLDNDMDIIFRYSGTNFNWYENDGNGNFGSVHSIPLGWDDVFGLTLFDVNGDGYQDIVNIENSEDEVRWFLNNGDGTFSLRLTDLSAISPVQNYMFGDLNSDGSDELIVSHGNSSVSWLDFDASGTSTAPQITSIVQAPVLFSDVDGDGDLDGYSHMSYADTLWLFINDGSLNFTRIASPSDMENYSLWLFDDLDLDGSPDLLAVHQSTFDIVWLENTGGFVYEFADTIVSDDDYTLADFYDMDGNGLSDFVTISIYFDNLLVYFQFPEGFAEAEPIADYPELYRPWSAHGADGDNDGGTDLLINHDSYLSWVLNNDGVFSIQPPFFDIVSSGYTSYQLIDLDNDNDLDIAAIYDSDILSVRINTDWTFGDWEQVLDMTFLWGSIRYKLSDFDNDDDLDIVHWGTGATDVWLSENNAGTYEAPVRIYGTGNIVQGTTSVDLGDLDNDGYEDILCIHTKDDVFAGLTREFFWLKNNSGDGSYTRSTIAPNYNTLRGSAAAKVNGDDFADIIISTSNEGLWWYPNNGNGTFGEVRSISLVGGQLSDMRYADLNMDGSLDIICRDGNRRLLWYNNDGSGNFSSENYLDTEHEVLNFNLIDVDDDGDEDIVYVNVVYSVVSWLENRISDGLGTVNGKLYWDRNEDGIFNGDDQPVPGFPLTLLPEEETYYTNANGDYIIYSTGSDDHSLVYDAPVILDCGDPVQFDLAPNNGVFEYNHMADGMAIEQDLVLTGDHICRPVSGRVFDDANENGAYDNGEAGVQGIRVSVGDQTVFTGPNGRYEASVPRTQDAAVSLIGAGSPTNGYCSISSISFEQTYPTDGAGYLVLAGDTAQLDTLDFGVIQDDQQAFDVGLYSLRVDRGNQAGKAFAAYMDFKAFGLVESACTLRIVHDPLLTFLASDIPPLTIGNTFVEWVFPPGSAPSWHCMEMTWFLADEAVMGDTLHWEATYLCPPGTDACPANDQYIRDVVIIDGPLRLAPGIATLYSVRPSGDMPEVITRDDNVLSYVVEYQNPLPSPVYSVTIIDTLPDDVLDASTVSYPFGSHRGSFSIIEPNILIWEITGIELAPQGENEAESYGFVQFNVSLTDDLPDGTLIPNSATVIFNNAETRSTNEIVHRLDMATGIELPGLSGLPSVEVFPNPFDRRSVIRWSELPEFNYDIELMTPTGQAVRTVRGVDGAEFLLDRGALPAGLYLINLYRSNDGLRLGSLKIIVQ